MIILKIIFFIFVFFSFAYMLKYCKEEHDAYIREMTLKADLYEWIMSGGLGND